MSNPPRTIRRDTRVFVSAVTRELGSVRKLVKSGLEDNDHHAVEQDNFPPDYRDVKDMLRERIAKCDAVVHVAGSCYGFEPSRRPPGAPRRSYTQLEYDIAVELGKPVYLFLTGEGFPADPHDPESPELKELQQAHRRRLTSTDKLYSQVASAEQLGLMIRALRLKVERLEGELQQVDHQVADLSQRSRRRFVFGSVALVGLAAIVAVVFNFAGKKVATNLTSVNTNLEELRKQYADPDVLAGKIKSHIRKRADEETAAAKAKAPDDWRKRDEIEKRRDQALERVEDLVETIRKGLAGEPDPIFIEAADVLNKQGVDEAIKYLEQKQPSIEKKIGAAKSSRDEAEQRLREAYRPKVLQADLYQVSLKWDAALKIREEVARDNPRWFEARTALGDLLKELARYGEAEAHLKGAVELAANPGEEATSLDDLASLLEDTNRMAAAEPLYRRALAISERSYGPDHADVALHLSNLAVLLNATNRKTEAEPLYRRALAISERLEGSDQPVVAIRLNNLASLLEDTNRMAAAEPLYRRALAISQQYYGPDHLQVTARLNNLATLLAATNRMAAAEPLYRRALAISERSYGPDHPQVARDLNNLAQLLQVTNRKAEAEPLMCRALSISERSYGPDHPQVATDINNLAMLLQDTSRSAEAEPLMRRTLASDERSNGPDHPDVAISLNNLAQLLEGTNRKAEAEPLMRRVLAILERSYGPDHPDVATSLNNLAHLLEETDRKAEAEPLMGRVIGIYSRFRRATGHEHRDFPVVLVKYRQLLSLLKLTQPKAEARINAAIKGTDKLSLIVPELERLLGPNKPVADVLASLDRLHKEQGKPAIYFLGSNEPITPHLDELFRPNGDALAAQGLDAFFRGAYADAVVLYDAGLELMSDQPVHVPAKLRTRMSRAGALRELGLVKEARDGLLSLLPELEEMPVADSLMKGRSRYHLALCQWRLGERALAQRAAEESLTAYGGSPKPELVDPYMLQQSEELLSDLKEGKAPPPRATIDAKAAVEVARARYQTREELLRQLRKLGLHQESTPVLDQILGSAKPTREVLDDLDRQCREQRKPEVWFLPLKESIAPKLDLLLGSTKTVEEVLDGLDRQYKEQGKPAVWFLPLSEPISPHLDELLGKPAK